MFQIEVTSLCMCVSISATVALVCVFAPKLYVVLLQPHKNVRQGASMYNNSYKSGRQSSFGSFPLPCPNGNLFNNLNANTQITQTTYNDVFSDDMDDLSCDEDANVNNNSTQTGNPENQSEWKECFIVGKRTTFYQRIVSLDWSDSKRIFCVLSDIREYMVILVMHFHHIQLIFA